MLNHVTRGLQCLLLVMATLALMTPARAQSTYGEIRGTVADASGGGGICATVTDTHQRTGGSGRAPTRDSGQYPPVRLLTGARELAVGSGRVRDFVIQNVIGRGGEVARMCALREVGGAAMEVKVSEARQVITTDVPTIVDSKSSEQLQSLPVNFRAGTTNTV